MAVRKGNSSSLQNHPGEPVELPQAVGKPWKIPRIKDARDEELLLSKQQIQGVPGVHLPQRHSQLDSETSLAQSTGGSSNSSRLPILNLLMREGTLPSQNIMQNDYNKKQQWTSNLTERLAGGQINFPLLFCIASMTDYVSSTQLQEPHIIKEQEVTGKVIQLTLVGSA